MNQRVLILAAALFAFGCTETKTKTVTEKAASSSRQGPPSGNPAFSSLTDVYTGINATDKFSIYLPGRTSFVPKDAAIAKIEEITVTLSEATIAELIADRKAEDPNFDEERFRKTFPTTQTAYKLIPLSAGTTTLTSTFKRRSNETVTTEVNLTVVEYAADAVQLGNTRYHNTAGTGNKIACTTCHGGAGAPSHAMGKIMEISDAEALQWITTGKVKDRVASITHTWEFDSDAEASGVVAYLRTLQTDDVEALTKMMFENEFADFNSSTQGGPPP